MQGYVPHLPSHCTPTGLEGLVTGADPRLLEKLQSISLSWRSP